MITVPKLTWYCQIGLLLLRSTPPNSGSVGEDLATRQPLSFSRRSSDLPLPGWTHAKTSLSRLRFACQKFPRTALMVDQLVGASVVFCLARLLLAWIVSPEPSIKLVGRDHRSYRRPDSLRLCHWILDGDGGPGDYPRQLALAPFYSTHLPHLNVHYPKIANFTAVYSYLAQGNFGLSYNSSNLYCLGNLIACSFLGPPMTIAASGNGNGKTVRIMLVDSLTALESIK